MAEQFTNFITKKNFASKIFHNGLKFFTVFTQHHKTASMPTNGVLPDGVTLGTTSDTRLIVEKAEAEIFDFSRSDGLQKTVNARFDARFGRFCF